MANEPAHTQTISKIRTLKGDIARLKGEVELPPTPTPAPESFAPPQTFSNAAGHTVHGKQIFDVESAYGEHTVQMGTIVTDRRSRNSIGDLITSSFSKWLGKTQEAVVESVEKLETQTVAPTPTPPVSVLPKREEPKAETPPVTPNIASYAAAPPHATPGAVQKIRTLAHDAEHVTGKPFTIQKPVESAAPKPPKKPDAPKPKPAPVMPTVEFKPIVVPPAPKIPLTTYTRETLDSTPVTPVNVPPRPTFSKPSTSLKEAVEKTEIENVDTTLQASSQKNESHPKEESAGWFTRFIARFKKVSVPKSSTPPEPTQIRERRAPTTHAPSVSVRTPIETSERPPTAPSQSVPSPILRPVPPAIQPFPAPTLSPSATKERPPLRPRPAVSPSVSRTRTYSTLVFTCIAVIAVGVGIYSILSFFPAAETDTPPAVVATRSIPGFLAVDHYAPLTLTHARAELLTLLTSLRENAATGVTHIYPVVPQELSDRPATVEEILPVFALRAEGFFLRALKEPMMFGAVRNETSEPYIIFNAPNFDSSFAGMLDWESRMSEDLAPFFGEPVLRTLLPQQTEQVSPRFVDALESNQTIRILYDETGSEHIVYAFVNDLIVITSSTEALATLLDRIVY